MESETFIEKLKDFKVKSVTVVDIDRCAGAYVIHYGRPIRNGLIYRPGYVVETGKDTRGRRRVFIHRIGNWYL